jgi:glycosyltransferase involved in cell wall biosynthesis
LKVVHIIEALGGGVYTYFTDLPTFFGNAEIRNDVNTTIIYSGNRKEIDPKKMRSEFSSGVSLVEVNMVREFSPLADVKSTFKLWRELKKINPDVIHLHSSKASVLGRIAAFFLFKKKKVFYTPHGYAFLRTDIAAVKRKFYWQIEKRMQQFFGGITIACGDTEYEIAQKIGKSKLVRNGVNLEKIREHLMPDQNSKLTIGIVGRISFQKNPNLFNQIALRFPEFNFVWIGNGDLKAALTSDNIKVKGWLLDRAEVLKELNAVDIYLQTSIWEGLPIALLEAMALQKPVVATNIIGNKDVVLHNETGFLFDDIGELETYFRILEEAKTRTELGKNAFARCEDLFDKNENFKQLLDLYTK